MSSPTDLVSGAVKKLKPKPRPTIQDAIQGLDGGNPAPRISDDAKATVYALGAASLDDTRRHERIHAERVASVADQTAREDAFWQHYQQRQRDAIGSSKPHRGRY